MLQRFLRALRIVASLEAEASALSSVASSQDSLHKQPKKKGIKSSIGRLFGKKEKGRLAHLAHRQVMVDPQGGRHLFKTEDRASKDFPTDVLFIFSRRRSDHDGRGHGRPGHGRGQAGNAGREGPQVKKEVSFIQSTASVVSMAQKSRHHIRKTYTTVNMSRDHIRAALWKFLGLK